jgi:hypothetical protein
MFGHYVELLSGFVSRGFVTGVTYHQRTHLNPIHPQQV